MAALKKKGEAGREVVYTYLLKSVMQPFPSSFKTVFNKNQNITSREVSEADCRAIENLQAWNYSLACKSAQELLKLRFTCGFVQCSPQGFHLLLCIVLR